tara:strand:- start:19448 stop:19876 length:429 start_codon:yes stop_codon:yes gene_type:complete
MARVVGLSRSRFYALMQQGVFPMPLYLIATKRPFFDERLRDECLNVRRTGLGVNDQPILFYPRRAGPPTTRSSKSTLRGKKKTPNINPRVLRLIELLKGLGVENPSPDSVTAALSECFPNGSDEKADHELVGAVYRHLRQSP